MMFFSGELICLRQAYSVVVLPDPVGPGNQDDAVALTDQPVQTAQVLAAETQPVQFQVDQVLSLVQQSGARYVRRTPWE